MTRTEASSREESSQPWGVLVDTANIPGGGRLHLYRHDEEYEILFGEEQLMGSWAYRSEEALATLVSDRLGGQAERVLIGGLGMGFTLAAALAAFAPPDHDRRRRTGTTSRRMGTRPACRHRWQLAHQPARHDPNS